ncbi:4'-phosphopantetheinyl transferase family protein [Candidatus Nitrospira allomarina]|uniref:4'-phosphopantetheinyl transferase superfamily protein n=1 Tax=Candidatus Nitrospira allomarina TaxID=3020900 RepID=A0AA96JTA7_9BACT|nr:4'-phosphopantetheinyl transferase superfamily protein [Candidatus Nitrospira allomarina]WNM59188.1 4'-phosphopantetheinyl transferase superfamily protein [Candidatus Nitrospira allomarina]
MVHVWRVHLDMSPRQADLYRADLSEEERARAERYRLPHHQYQFISTRGILRNLMGHYVGISPGTLRLENNIQGKPFLIEPPHLLQFNVSHTSGMALLAFTIEHAVGIDVEQVNRNVSDQDIATRYFSPQEAAYLATLSPDKRTQDFLTYWTCKEAYLKMQGIGLSGGMAQCEIALGQDGLKATVRSTHEPDRENDCSLFRINAGQAYIGALSVDCPSVEVVFWDWKD